jgi:hypothetical protein
MKHTSHWEQKSRERISRSMSSPEKRKRRRRRRRRRIHLHHSSTEIGNPSPLIYLFPNGCPSDIMHSM